MGAATHDDRVLRGIVTFDRVRFLLLAALFASVAGLLQWDPVRSYIGFVFLALFALTTGLKRVRARRARRFILRKGVSSPENVVNALLRSGVASRGACAVAVTPDDRTIQTGGRWDEDTPAELGSITKSLTGLALASCVLDGVLSLDEPIGEFVDVPPPLAAVTIGQLATHTSGLPRLGGGLRTVAKVLTGSTQPYADRDSQRVVDIARQARLGPPKRRYSNLGFELLAVVLARATGESYHDVMRVRVFEPAGMHDAAFVGHSPVEPRGHDVLGFPVRAWRDGDDGGGDGGVQASACDMAALAAALIDPDSAIAPAFELARRPLDDLGFRYALGWIIDVREPDAFRYWHNGGTAGAGTYLGIVPGVAGVFVAIDRSPQPIVDDLGAGLLGRIVAAPDMLAP